MQDVGLRGWLGGADESNGERKSLHNVVAISEHVQTAHTRNVT